MKEFNSLSASERDAHQARFGKYNDFPPGWHEIGAEEFAKSLYFGYSPVMSEYRQMNYSKESGKACISARLEFMHDGSGFSLVNDFWGGKVSFFKFGCDHEWGDPSAELEKRGIKLSGYDHASYCVKCGFLSIVDSSD